MRTMFLSLVALAFASCIDAEAATYSDTFDWDVIRTTDVYPSDGSAYAIATRILHKCVSGGGHTCPADGTTAAVTPTFTQITCLIDNGGYVYAIFKAKNDEMPSTWPSSVSCSYVSGSDTFTATINLHASKTSGAWAHADVSSWTPGDGVTFDFDPASGEHGAVRKAHRVYPLPSSYTYVDEDRLAVRNGSDWTGVRCVIDEDAIPSASSYAGPVVDGLLVAVSESAAEGTGHCPVQRTGESTQNITVTIDRP